MVLDQAVRSLPLGGAYPLGELSGGGKVSMRLARRGDPTYRIGRQTQLRRRHASPGAPETPGGAGESTGLSDDSRAVQAKL